MEQSGAYTLNGTALTIGSDGVVNNSNFAQTVALDINLGANQPFASNTANLLVSGAINGTAALTKMGNKTLTLTGNPLCTKNKYRERIIVMASNIGTLDDKVHPYEASQPAGLHVILPLLDIRTECIVTNWAWVTEPLLIITTTSTTFDTTNQPTNQ